MGSGRRASDAGLDVKPEAQRPLSAKSSGQAAEAFRSGVVGVLGRTNVGKSTFLNAVLREKLLISSSKPQATRHRIRCVLTTDQAQIIFVDTPGLHDPTNKLGRRLVREAYRGTRGVDVLLYMTQPWGEVTSFDRRTLDRLQRLEIPIILLINKIDLAKGNALEETLIAYEATNRFAELIPISAARGDGLDDAVSTTIGYLPFGAPLFPTDVKCDRPVEFLIEEIIREQVFGQTYQEIPYSTTVHVKWLRESEENDRIEIRAEILVARDSQRGILVGKGGGRIKQIGTQSRRGIERLLGQHVYLDLIVGVSRGWTDDDAEIRRVIGS